MTNPDRDARRVPRTAFTLEAGSSYAVVTRNVARLLRRGFSLDETRSMVLAEAGLLRYPTPPRPTIH